MSCHWLCAWILLACMGCGGGKKSSVASVQDTMPLTRGQIESLSTEMVWIEDAHEFGEITVPSVVSHRFTFVNTGQSPLVVLQVSASCGCVVTNWPQDPIAIGDTSSIKVAFDSEGREGIQLKRIYVTANTEPAQHILTMQGTVLPKTAAITTP